MSALTATLFLPAEKEAGPSHAEVPRPKRRSLITDVEREVRESGRPSVAVNEAKKALFKQAKLKAFHFVIYEKQGDNWLLWCGEPTAAIRQEMEQWAQVFGPGFQIVYAIRRKDGIVYRTHNGTRLMLNRDMASFATLASPSSPPAVPSSMPTKPQE